MRLAQWLFTDKALQGFDAECELPAGERTFVSNGAGLQTLQITGQ